MIKAPQVLFLSALSVAWLSAAPVSENEIPRQGVTQEIWGNQWGGAVADLINSNQYKNNAPTRVAVLDSLKANNNGDQYGARYTAILSTPKEGEYTFWLTADDSAELWLSTDENPANLKKIAELTSYVPENSFQDRGKSKPVNLEQDKKYFIQILHKQAGGGDHLAVAWQGKGMRQEVISSIYLKPVLDEKKKKAVEQTMRVDKRKAELASELKTQNESSVSDWMGKLPEADQKLLAEILIKDEARLMALPLEERKTELSVYAEMAKGIVPTVENPIKNPAAKRLLYLEERYLQALSPEELLSYGPHRLSSMLGDIPADAAAGKKTVPLSSRGDKWDSEMVSTGVYALPGKPVTVTLPENLANAKLNLIVGHHVNAGVHQDPPLLSTPDTTRHFPLAGAKTTVTSPHGGIVFLQVPKEVALKKTPVTFENVIEAPRFILGQTSNKDWQTIRNAPAPWGELISENLLLLVKSDDLKKLEDPKSLIAWWNENTRHHQDFYAYYPGYPFRMHASLYPREGYAYWPLEWQPHNMPRLLDLAKMKETNDGLFLHEHGHHGDPDEIIVGYWGESTCNWAGYYMKSLGDFDWKDTVDTHMKKLFDPADKSHEEIKQDDWYKISTKGTHHWSYPITSMMLGYTADFGWKPFKETIRRMRDPQDVMYKWDFVQGDMKDQTIRDQAKIDRYLIGLSEGAKRDVRPYFEHFKLRPSAGAAKYLDGKKLAKWDLSYLPSPENMVTKKDTALTIPAPEKSVLSMSKGTTIQWNPKTAKGSVKVAENGDVVYTPAKGFVGEDKIAYVLKNASGSSPVKFIGVKVEK